MTRTQKWTTVVAAIAAIVIATLMIARHGQDAQQSARVRAEVAPDDAIFRALQDAKVPVNGLLVRSVGGVVVVRGSGDKAAVDQVLKRLNVQRVANLVAPGFSGDDESIRRQAERQLAATRALDGCTLKVSCSRGVIRVSGTVQQELQVDAARSALRNVDGAQEVRVELTRM